VSQLLSDLIMLVFHQLPMRLRSVARCRGKHDWKTWEYSGHVECQRCGLDSKGYFGK